MHVASVIDTRAPAVIRRAEASAGAGTGGWQVHSGFGSEDAVGARVDEVGRDRGYRFAAVFSVSNAAAGGAQSTYPIREMGTGSSLSWMMARRPSVQ